MRLGHARLASDQLDGALEAFSAAIKLQPTWPALFIARAQVELARGEAGTALGDLERALEGEVQSGEVHSLMAEAYRRVGQQERADASAALAGDNLGTEPVPDTWRNRIRNHVVTYGLLKPMSDSYVKAGRLDEAQGCWSRVLQYDPESVRAHRERAAALLRIRWAIKHALPSGVLPEQVDPFTGEPVGVNPLTWSHGMMLGVIARMAAAPQPATPPSRASS